MKNLDYQVLHLMKLQVKMCKKLHLLDRKGLAAFAVGSFYLKRKDVNKWEIQEKLYITTFALLRS